MIADVLAQHLEEACSLWPLRDAATLRPHYSLAELSRLDARIDAHLDGLRLAGDGVAAMCQDQLSWQEPGEIFTAAALAIESKTDARIEPAILAGVEDTATLRGLVSALAWISQVDASATLTRLASSEDARRRRATVAALAVRRELDDRVLRTFLDDPDPWVRARALRGIGEMGAVDYSKPCSRALESDDPRLRYAAAWTASLLGFPGGLPVLREIALSDAPRAEEACDLAARRMTPADALRWHEQLAAAPETRRLAIVAARALGDPALVPWLLETMQVDELARPAGEAFTHITGLDLAYEDLDGEWPEGFAAGPTEDPADEEVAMDRDEDLPWPEPTLIAGWWASNERRFAPGVRHLCGRPLDETSLARVLREGLQRQRAAAALELAVLRGGPLFEVRARGDRQRELLRG